MNNRVYSIFILMSGLFCLGLMNCNEKTITSSVDTIRYETTIYDTVYSYDTMYIDTLLKPQYVGSKACDTCHHKEIYKKFKESGHPYKLNISKGVSPPSYPSFVKPPALPDWLGSWDRVSYVIGGYMKNPMFLNDSGYLQVAPTKVMPYSCGKCHATGYSPEGHQDSLAGIKGTWAEPGVQCEACHGAGSHHVKSGGRIHAKLDRSSSMCAKCHIRGDANVIAAKHGLSDSAFIESHAQYNELIHSKKAGMECVDCHDPHSSTHYDSKAAGDGIKYSCTNCHGDEADTYISGTSHSKEGVTCKDCHMPQVSGSTRTHLFRIATDTSKHQFSTDSTASGYISLKSACLSCHGDTTYPDMPKGLQTKNAAWAAKFAKSIHRSGTEAPNVYAGGRTCSGCHSKIAKNWSSTAHGENFRDNTVNGQKFDFIHGFGGACQACHVTGYDQPTGWKDIAMRVSATTNDSMALEGVQCESCHGPGSRHATNGKASYQMNPVDHNNSCVKCHVGSYNQMDLSPGPADSLTVEIMTMKGGLKHPQALLYNGVMGYEYPGKSYSHSGHAKNVINGCVTCHMFKGTGHDLKADREACLDCHKGYADSIRVTGTGDSLLSVKQQDTIFTKIAILNHWVNLFSFVTAADSTDSAKVKNTFAWKAANYNLNVVKADGSLGIHDYKYVKQLLDDAIADTARYIHILQQ